MDHVAFITSEDSDDLIVSFAIVGLEPTDVQSIILLRTPKYEALLDETERGVSFSDERSFDETEEWLQELCFEKGTVTLKTDRDEYKLDVSFVDSGEISEAGYILKKMNFDNRFVLSIQ